MGFSASELYEGSFRGIPFLIPGEVGTSGGPKIAPHDYPNDSRHYAEPMGSFKRSFTITAWVSGEDYIVNRDLLMAALEDPSIGILIHPFQGIYQVTPVKPYSLSEDITRLGVAIFTMTFQVSDPAFNPESAGDLIGNIINVANQLDSRLQEAFQLAFKVSNFLPESFLFAKTKLNNLNNELSSFKTIATGRSAANDMENEQKSFAANLAPNISAPVSLAKSMSSLFATANGVSDSPTATVSKFKDLFTVGLADPIIVIRSQLQAEQFQNQNAINYIVNCYALLYAYLNAAQISFSNDLDLQAMQESLEAEYKKMIAGNVTPAQPVNFNDIIDGESYDRLQALRNLARQQFDKDSKNVSKVVRVYTNPRSVTLISYDYYESTDKAEEILALNNLTDAAFVSGTINILTSQQ